MKKASSKSHGILNKCLQNPTAFSKCPHRLLSGQIKESGLLVSLLKHDTNYLLNKCDNTFLTELRQKYTQSPWFLTNGSLLPQLLLCGPRLYGST